jgi:hypothetical protein
MSEATKKRHSETRQRTAQVIARLTPFERLEIEEAANQAGLTLGSYVRAKVLTGRPPRAVHVPPVERQALAQLLAQLGRLNGNVYQISRAANFHEQFETQALWDALKDLARMRDALLEALGRKLT